METSKGSVPEKEFEHLRNGEGGVLVLWLLQAQPKRFGLKRLCP